MSWLVALVLLLLAHLSFWPVLLALLILFFFGLGGVVRSLLWIVAGLAHAYPLMVACFGLAVLMSWASHYARVQAAKQAWEAELARMQLQARLNAQALAWAAQRIRALS